VNLLGCDITCETGPSNRAIAPTKFLKTLSAGCGPDAKFLGAHIMLNFVHYTPTRLDVAQHVNRLQFFFHVSFLSTVRPRHL